MDANCDQHVVGDYAGVLPGQHLHKTVGSIHCLGVALLGSSPKKVLLLEPAPPAVSKQGQVLLLNRLKQRVQCKKVMRKCTPHSHPKIHSCPSLWSFLPGQNIVSAGGDKAGDSRQSSVKVALLAEAAVCPQKAQGTALQLVHVHQDFLGHSQLVGKYAFPAQLAAIKGVS